MSVKKVSAEIFELDSARSRLRTEAIDPGNFLAVGPYLEAVRVSAGLSVQEIVESTHIKPQFIEAIEAMALKKLPSKPFAIGFVRAYAEALELDADAVVARFKDEAGYERESETMAAAPRQAAKPEPKAEPLEERSELTLLVFVAALAFTIWCASLITRPQDTEVPLKLVGVPQLADSAESGQAIMTPLAADALPAPGGLRSGDDLLLAPIAPQIGPERVEARIINRVEPVFPPRCIAGAQATESVELAFTIRTDGLVVSERVVNATNPCFERAALNAIRQWTFSPRVVDGLAKTAFDQRAVVTFAKPL